MYMTNHFLIELSAADPYVTGLQDRDNAYYHAFIHEYWHYLQNVTTLAGYRSFTLTQILAHQFTHTLKGRDSGGSAALAPGLAELIPGLIDLYDSFSGNLGPKDDWVEGIASFEVERIDKGSVEINLGGKSPKNPIITVAVRATDQDGAAHQGKFILGTIAIEESVACMVEEEVHAKLGLPQEELLPPFPYRIVEAVLKYLMGDGSFSSKYYPAALGTLALLSLYPGSALVEVGELFSAARNAGDSEDQALNKVTLRFLQNFKTQVDAIVRLDLAQAIAKTQGRGLWGGAVQYVCEIIRRGLDHRIIDPYFDIKAAFSRSEQYTLDALLADFPPCDISQEQANGKSIIYRLDPTPTIPGQPSSTDFTRTLQAQQHFVFSHISNEAEFEESVTIANDPERTRCPFFDACPLEYRLNHLLICSRTPWRAFDGTTSGCWYAVGVMGAAGLVTISKLGPGAGRSNESRDRGGERNNVKDSGRSPGRRRRPGNDDDEE